MHRTIYKNRSIICQLTQTWEKLINLNIEMYLDCAWCFFSKCPPQVSVLGETLFCHRWGFFWEGMQQHRFLWAFLIFLVQPLEPLGRLLPGTACPLLRHWACLLTHIAVAIHAWVTPRMYVVLTHCRCHLQWPTQRKSRPTDSSFSFLNTEQPSGQRQTLHSWRSRVMWVCFLSSLVQLGK